MVFIWVTFLVGTFRSVWIWAAILTVCFCLRAQHDHELTYGILIHQDISYSLSSDPDFILGLDNWKLSFFILEYFLYTSPL